MCEEEITKQMQIEYKVHDLRQLSKALKNIILEGLGYPIQK